MSGCSLHASSSRITNVERLMRLVVNDADGFLDTSEGILLLSI
jgi:hypothetical protein